MPDIQIRAFEPSLLHDALSLLERSDSTSRSRETWEKNGLVGVLAYEDSHPIGIIPLEPRTFKISGQDSVNALWVSGAHVDEKSRSQGIGGALDRSIARFYPKAQAVFAFRQDEGTKAFQWYMKTGYKPLCPILAFKKDVPASGFKFDYHIYESVRDLESKGGELLNLFNRIHGKYGGHVVRTEEFWVHKQAYHYYREFFTYTLLTLEDNGAIIAYAFLGQTSMRDHIKRFEILEIAADNEHVSELFDAVFDLARQRQLAEVRIQSAARDPWKDIIQKEGFKQRWETYIIAKELKPGALIKAETANWKYFQIDYI